MDYCNLMLKYISGMTVNAVVRSIQWFWWLLIWTLPLSSQIKYKLIISFPHIAHNIATFLLKIFVKTRKCVVMFKCTFNRCMRQMVENSMLFSLYYICLVPCCCLFWWVDSVPLVTLGWQMKVPVFWDVMLCHWFVLPKIFWTASLWRWRHHRPLGHRDLLTQ